MVYIFDEYFDENNIINYHYFHLFFNDDNYYELE